MQEGKKNMKEDIIIYGAGNVGKRVYDFLKDSYNVLFFVDKDIDKQKNGWRGVCVYDPECLQKYADTKLVLAGRYYDEMKREALSMGVKKIYRFAGLLEESIYSVDEEKLNKEKTIDLGKFLESEREIALKNLTFIPGGSRVLDYAFLRVLAKRFQLKNYLEIGTYIGESIHVVSDLCEVCHSITAPVDADYSMKNWCKKYNRPDYSERLACDENIVHHYCDSKTFDYDSITEKLTCFS